MSQWRGIWRNGAPIEMPFAIRRRRMAKWLTDRLGLMHRPSMRRHPPQRAGARRTLGRHAVAQRGAPCCVPARSRGRRRPRHRRAVVSPPPRLASRAHTREWGAARRFLRRQCLPAIASPAPCGGACGGHREPWLRATQRQKRQCGRRRHGRGQAWRLAGCGFVAKLPYWRCTAAWIVFSPTPLT